MYRESKEFIVTQPVRIGQYHALAEAIRRGCKIAPQKNNGSEMDNPYKACALGAAQLAIGAPNSLNRKGKPLVNYYAVGKHFHISVWCTMQIIWRNDISDHPREAIADWLDTY